MKHSIKSLLLGLTCAVALTGTAFAQSKAIDIPAGNLKSALDEYIQQSGVQLIYNADQVRDLTTGGVHGTLSPDEALRQLLRGTTLVVHRDESGALVVANVISRKSALEQAPAAVEEVFVTAQRRLESVHAISMAVTALTQDSLDRQHVTSMRELSRVVPSLSFTEPSPGQAVISLRGLTTESSLSPVVGYYFDETPFELRSDIYAGEPALELFDVQRVEVLRGPQGTLFGAGAMGGAIRIISNKPSTDAAEAHLEQEVSFNDGGAPSYFVAGAYNQPLSDDLAIRIVATDRHTGGYIDGAIPTNYYAASSTPAVAKHNENSSDWYSTRISLKWSPDDSLSITPSIIYQRIDPNGLNYYDSRTTNHANYRLFSGKFRDKLFVGNFLVEKDFGFAQLTSSTSYLNKTGYARTDYSSAAANLDSEFTGETTTQPLFPTVNLRPTTYNQVSQEVRMTSHGHDWLRWTAGVYYNHVRETSGQQVDSPSLGSFISGIFGVSPPDETLIGFTGWNTDEEIAAFGELTIVPIQQFEVTAGVRAFELKQKVYQDVEGLLGSGPTAVEKSKADGLDPKFVISYKPNSDYTAYVTAAKGFRAGGPNGVLLGRGCTYMGAYRDTYEPDGVWNYEVGLKSQFWNRRLSVNLAAYRIDWNNIQGEVDSTCGAFEANIGKARIKGFEAEVTAIPIDDLSISLEYSYNSANVESVKAGLSGGVAIAPGDRLIDTPQNQYSFSAEYTPTVIWRFKPYVDLNFQHVGGTPTNYAYKTPAFYRPAYDNLDLAIGVRTDRYDASIYAQNLTNSLQIVDIIRSSVGQALYNPNRGLTVGVNIKEQL